MPIPEEVRLRAPAAVIRAEYFDVALAARDWTVPSREARSYALVISAGQGLVRMDEGALDIEAPSILWLPFKTAQAIQVSAGACGHLLSVDDDYVARAVADSPNAMSLRRTADRVLTVSADRLAGSIDTLVHSFKSIEREIREPQHGAYALLSAHLGLILLHLWRLSGLAEASADERDGSVALQRFRQLLELHYREHWPIEAYARALGVTADHLHKACRRGAGVGPLALIQGRLMEEAKTRLIQTSLSVAQIAFGLGFRDPAYFSRAFRAHIGTPPGVWRRAALQLTAREPDSFAAWP